MAGLSEIFSHELRAENYIHHCLLMQNTLSNQTCAVWALFKKEIQIKFAYFVINAWYIDKRSSYRNYRVKKIFERVVVRVVLGI